MPVKKIELPNGKVLEVQVPEGATEDDILGYAQEMYSQNPTIGRRPDADTGSIFDRFMGKFDDALEKAKFIEQQAPQSTLGMAGDVIGGAVSAIGQPLLSQAGQTVGAPLGYGVALSRGLTPGTPEFNQVVAEMQMTGGKMLSEAAQPTAGMGKTVADAITGAVKGVGETQLPGVPFVEGTSKTLADLPPVSGYQQELSALQRQIGMAGQRPPSVRQPQLGDIPPMQGPPAPVLARDIAAGVSEGDLAAVARQAQSSPDLVAAQERLGTNLPPELLTSNEQFRNVARTFIQPGSEGGQNRLKSIEDFKQRVYGVVDKFRGSRDLSRVEDKVKNQLWSDIGRLNTQIDKDFESLGGIINKSTQITADNTMAYLEGRIRDLNGVRNLSRFEKELYRKLRPRNIYRDGQFVKTETPTYGLIDDFAKRINKARYTADETFSDMDLGLIKKLQMEMSKDRENGIGIIGGPDAAQKLREANALVRTRKDIEDSVVNLFGEQTERDKIVGSMLGDFSQSVKSLADGDYDRFRRTLNNVPMHLRKEVVSSVLMNNFARSTQDGTFDLRAFNNWYDGVNRNTKSRALVLKNLEPGMAKDLEAARKLSGSFIKFEDSIPNRNLEQAVTGRYNFINNVSRKLAPRLAEFATSFGARQTGMVHQTVATMFPTDRQRLQAANDFLTSPEFDYLSRTIGTLENTKAINRAARSEKFKTMAKALGIGEDVSQTRLWILNALQSEMMQEQQQQQQAMGQ